MKVIQFKINETHGRMHVDYQEQLVPMLRRQGLIKDDDTLAVDWSNTGRYVITWLKKYHAVCPYCQTANSLGVEDMGFEEFECSRCDNTFTIPETVNELPEFNNHSLAEAHKTAEATHYRIMCRGEDGQEFCLKNGVPSEYAELVCAGYQTHYTEGQTCWLEPEETYADLIRNNLYDDSDY